MNEDKIRALIRLLDETGTTEIEWQHGDERIRVARAPAPAVMGTTPTGVSNAPTGHAPELAARDEWDSPEVPAPVAVIHAPLVGTFYRAPAPTAPPFIEVGDRVRPGQTLCIVEAMKVMNEVNAEVEGRLAAALVENGSPVEFGEPLFRIDPA